MTLSNLNFSVRFQGSGYSAPYDADPAQCPLCHHAVAPELRIAGLVSGNPQVQGSVVDAAYTCTNRPCGKLFIATFVAGRDGLYHLHSLAPQAFTPPVISAEILTVSEKFAGIFEQASHAEASGLDGAGKGPHRAKDRERWSTTLDRAGEIIMDACPGTVTLPGLYRAMT